MSGLVIITGASFFVSLIAVKVLIGVLTKLGMQQMIRKEMPDSHQVKAKTPMMGGIGFFIATLAITAIAGGFQYPKVRVVLLIATVSFFIGLADDLAKFTGKNTEGVKARYKLIIEIGLGVVLAWFVMNSLPAPFSVLVPFGAGTISLKSAFLFIPFVIAVYAGTVNSVNFTDGVDGLLSGCFIAVSGAFILLVYRTGDHSLVPLLCAVCGAVAGFLWFNSHPAAIFMGDSGSLFLGGLLAATAVVERAEFFLVIAGLVFVAEMLSVMIQVTSFKLTKKRVFRMAPIHHHFELGGWSETHVSQRFWIASAVLSAIALGLFTL